ncbi:uncharacterized protein LOC127792329 [Diospyros lotus]|uniref:uncharacterized protein LOC127792329 n=1 Tax=Diospyros lotus TaxID=55363 RepID=UPI00224E0041|nr:uncharacterized protein LOC127792329 [Diospyros lotus]
MAGITIEDEEEEEGGEEGGAQTQKQRNCDFVLRLMSKRRTWVCLFAALYAVLLFSSWSIIRSVLSWYEGSSAAAAALGASAAVGAVVGVLAMAAALTVAVPATVMTWISVLVLLACCGKRRRALVAEARKLTAEICGVAARMLIREGNVVAAVCAVLGFFALVRWGREEVASSTLAL